jgi:predicted dehydrogenase
MPAKSHSISKPFRVGVIGCGDISRQYFQHLKPFAAYAKITACADMDLERARAKAVEQGIKACTVDELLTDPEIDAVLNLTIPAAHVKVNLAALKAGKHVYCEKPFSFTAKEGAQVLKEALKRRLRVGCAPDTVLGGGIQTARKLIDEPSANRLQRSPTCSVTATSAGTRIPLFITRKAAARSSTWGRIISRHWSC